MRTFRLVIACPDGVGIVAKVSNFLATYNGWITEASHHSDNDNGWFFMRHEIRADSLPFDLDGFRQAFAPIAREFSIRWSRRRAWPVRRWWCRKPSTRCCRSARPGASTVASGACGACRP